MQVNVYRNHRGSWMFRVEHMGCAVSGWSLDEQGARHAAEKSQEFLAVLATRGIEVVDGGDDYAGTEVGT